MSQLSINNKYTLLFPTSSFIYLLKVFLRMPRSTGGRKKIPIEKMEKDANLQVTFSKRRQGLFKKASELCTLCNVGMGVIVFSPGQKVFSFGNPDVKFVIDNFKNHNHSPLLYTQDGLNPTIQNLNSLLTQVNTKFFLLCTLL